MGPELQTIQLEGGISSTHSLLRRSFKDLWVISEAWSFGTRPVLDGGSLFQIAFQYGGGVKVRLSPHLVMRADARATISEQPHFWGKGAQHEGHLHHRSFTGGLGVSF